MLGTHLHTICEENIVINRAQLIVFGLNYGKTTITSLLDLKTYTHPHAKHCQSPNTLTVCAAPSPHSQILIVTCLYCASRCFPRHWFNRESLKMESSRIKCHWMLLADYVTGPSTCGSSSAALRLAYSGY